MAENPLFGVLLLKVRFENGVQLEMSCPFELEALRLMYKAFGTRKVKEMFYKIKEMCVEFLEEFEEGEELLEYVKGLELEETERNAKYLLEYVALVQRLISDGKKLGMREYFKGVVMPFIRALNFAAYKEPEYMELVRWLLKLSREASPSGRIRLPAAFLY